MMYVGAYNVRHVKVRRHISIPADQRRWLSVPPSSLSNDYLGNLHVWQAMNPSRSNAYEELINEIS